MFRAPLCPSSGAHDDSVGYHIGRPVLELLLDGSLSAGRMDEFPDRRLLQPSVRKLIHPPKQLQLENQTAYVVTNAIVVSS
jgi:hypothetical protein